MPLSEIQAEILRLIAANRTPESYLAGATVLHRSAGTPRFSQDLDYFHDLGDSVATCAEQDAHTLIAAGHGLQWILRAPTFHRAVVTVRGDQLRIEWAQDSAFRFYPVMQDDLCGYRLHDTDAAINKVLALAGRSEARDFVDVLHLDRELLSLGAMAWAACGKDPGFTPEFLLDQANRHTAYTQADLGRLHLLEPLDLRALKRDWFAALETAQALVASLPPAEIGCLYLNPQQQPVTPDAAAPEFAALTRHSGSVSGAWPTVAQAGGGRPG
jgi:hypothetical protein